VGRAATGSYHLPLATAVPAAGNEVLVGNPPSIARSSQAVLARTTTRCHRRATHRPLRCGTLRCLTARTVSPQVSMRIILTWLFNSAGSSVLLCNRPPPEHQLVD
jgi:hypothetical protein